MSSNRPVLPPPADSDSRAKGHPRRSKSHAGSGVEFTRDDVAATKVTPVRSSSSAPGARTRTAHLRLTRIDPFSVMKMTFLLAIAMGIVMVVAVTIVWSVLSAVGVWDSINSAVQQVLGTESGQNFDVGTYIGTSRVIGFSLLASVINVVLLTAIATLAAFVYNLAAALLGGVEMTWAEDR